MKNIITGFLLLIIFFIQSPSGYGKSYAILISGGYAMDDLGTDELNRTQEQNKQDNACYWYDLVLAYETLINEAGYSHDDVLVFYGAGSNWEHSLVSNKRYDLNDT